MRLVLLTLAAIISVGIGVSTAYQFYVLLWQPAQWVEVRAEAGFAKMLRYASIVAAMIGVGYMIYKGVEAMLWWIPRSWVNFDEDGEPQWIGHSIAGLVAFAGAILVMTKLEERAIELVNSRRKQS
ncbi:hypothetical protein [Bradyrhizobium manausense]|uniref:hypothetical protein n=1 Tax=Bradyrhizobium manausense TaxID=989370 RepID=UPI001BAA00C5|nr:hypothetical protein [Bradyrhizobium manausense]MBR0721794.1 hypothetical protein [Bradyrhizobium manausense]